MISWNLTEEERRRTCVSPNLRLPLTSPSYSPELSSFLLRNSSVLNVSSDLEFCCCRVRAGKLRRQTRDNLHHIVRFSFYTLTTDDNQWQGFMPPVVLHPYYFTWPYFRGVIVSEITAQSLQRIFKLFSWHCHHTSWCSQQKLPSSYLIPTFPTDYSQLKHFYPTSLFTIYFWLGVSCFVSKINWINHHPT